MKKILLLFLSFILILSTTSCAPSRYTKGVEYDDYPDDIIPLDRRTTVFKYNNDDDEVFKLSAGASDDVEGVTEFYTDYFEDEGIVISDQDGDDEAYYFEGIYDGYAFVVDITEPSGRWEEKYFKAIIEIELEVTDEEPMGQRSGTGFTQTDVAVEATGTFDTLGGRLDVPSTSEMAGSYVVIPEAAAGRSINVSIGIVKGNYSNAPDSIAPVALHLDTEGYDGFSRPMEVTIQYAKTEAEKAKTPIGYYIDDQGKLNQVMVKNINRTDGTFTFYTFHASTYTYSFAKDFTEVSESGDTGFKPSIDGFREKNQGSTKYSGGECYGMSTFAKWYFLNKKGEGSFFDKFNEPEMGVSPTGDIIVPQDIIATQAFMYTKKQSSILWNTEQQFSSIVTTDANGVESYTQSNEVAALCILDSLDFFSEPVEIGIYGGGGHSVLGYKYEKTATDVKIYIYDPNYPGDDNQFITYNIANKTYTLSGYSAGKLDKNLTCTGFGTFSMVSEYEKILEAAKGNFASTPAHILVTSHVNGETVSTGTIYLEGTVDTFDNMGEQLGDMIEIVTSDGQVYTDYLYNNGTSPQSFSIEVPVKSGENKFLINIIYHDEWYDEQYLPNDLYGYFIINSDIPANVIYITLTWDDKPDVDLYVYDPMGSVSYFENYSTADGGVLDIDDTSSYGPEHFTLSADDTIRWGEAYQVRLHYYSGEGPTYYTVNVQANTGTIYEINETYSGTIGASDSDNYGPSSSGGDWVDICEVIPLTDFID